MMKNIWVKVRNLQRRLQRRYRQLRQFFTYDLWEADPRSFPVTWRWGAALCRMGAIMVLKLRRDQCFLHASALSYLTLVAVVPALAIVSAVAEGFGVQKRLMETVREQLTTLPENVEAVLKPLLMTVQEVNYAVMGLLGTLLMFWTVIKVLGRIETTFNTVWGAPRNRTLVRKFTDYVSVIVIVPFLILGATSVNTLVSSEGLISIIETYLGPVTRLYEFGMGLTGIVSLCLAFSCLNLFMPNTRVPVRAALAGGLVAGLLWYGAQHLYFVSQIAVSRYNVIYGTFAALPFFLIWVYASWLIMLIGAEAGYALQYRRMQVHELASPYADSFATREALSLVVVYEVCRAFYQGDRYWELSTFAREHDVSDVLLSEVVTYLEDAGLITAVDPVSRTYVPGRALEKITPQEVVSAIRGAPSDKVKHQVESLAPALNDFCQKHWNTYSRAMRAASMRQLLAGDRADHYDEA